MSICTIIIGVKRYTRCSAQEHPVDRFTLRAARTVVGLVLDYVAPPRDGDVDRFISMLYELAMMCALQCSNNLTDS